MVPPPPPSPSYLLSLDTSSSEEEDSVEKMDPIIRKTMQVDKVASGPILPETLLSNKQDKVEPDEEEAIENVEKAEIPGFKEELQKEQHISSPAKKKKKRRKRKKKKRSKQKHVSFGTVAVRHHKRCLGTDVVPLDGCWPLGISDEVEKEEIKGIDQAEQEKQEELRKRFEHKFDCRACDDSYLETRQYDYKKPVEGCNSKNPLFGLSKEKDRMKILLESCGIEEPTPVQAPASPKHKKKGHHNTRRRSGSVDHTKRRSGSIDKFEYNDVYTSTLVKHVRNELEEVRNHRGLEHAGCSCHRSHHSKRMTERRLKEELRKRGKLPPPNTNKHELQVLLESIQKTEPACWGTDCPCVRNGIACHANVCSCWCCDKKERTISECKELCGNKFGLYVVDVKGIEAARQEYCQQVVRD